MIYYVKNKQQTDDGFVVEYTSEVTEAERFAPNDRGDYVEESVLRPDVEGDGTEEFSDRIWYECNRRRRGCKRRGCTVYRYSNPCDKTSDVTAAVNFYETDDGDYVEQI